MKPELQTPEKTSRRGVLPSNPRKFLEKIQKVKLLKKNLVKLMHLVISFTRFIKLVLLLEQKLVKPELQTQEKTSRRDVLPSNPRKF